MSRWIALVGFLVVAVGGGMAIGLFSVPGEWYSALNKPSFNPPSWIFGPVWSVLYIAIGVAGWRAWQSGDRRLQTLWWVQMLLNFAWSPAFFVAQMPGLALLIILPLLGSILLFILRAWRVDGVAAGLFMPYAAWVSFATTLNTAIYLLN